jgi:hypothetical protein
MRVYYAPDFSRKAEIQEPKDRNILKMLANYLQGHEKKDLAGHPTISILSTNQKNLYILQLHGLRTFASFRSDERGDYVILVDFER